MITRQACLRQSTRRLRLQWVVLDLERKELATTAAKEADECDNPDCPCNGGDDDA